MTEFDSEWQRVMTAETPAPRDPYADVPHPAELAEAERMADPVEYELRRLRTRAEAERRLRREQRAGLPRPALRPLTEWLAEPDPPVTYRISDLWPSGGRVLLAAQYKAGKTTLVGNLLRSLVDGDPFLGQYAVTAARRVVLLDDELDEAMLRRWLRQQGIQRTDAVVPVALRGRVSTLDLLDPDVRAEWAADLRALGVDVVILDCLRPVMDALGLDENREAGRLLVAVDALLAECGATEAVVVHHMGHSGERSRGDSRLRDWPDVEWRLVRAAEDPASPRYFSAFGRDVHVPESLLHYDEHSRHLSLVGGSRRDAAARAALDDVLHLLAQTPEPLSGRTIEDRMRETDHSRDAVRKALGLARTDERVLTLTGARGAILYSLRRT